MSSVVAIASPGRGLLRILGLAFGIAVVVGETVGVGIMRTSDRPLATAMPKARGPYVYVRRAFGDYLGFVSGWGDYAIYVLADAYLAIAGSEFLAEIWPVCDGS